jgi:hypothetical protein
VEEVLAAMVADGVLRAIQTRQGAVVYGPGQHFKDYLDPQTEWAASA